MNRFYLIFAIFFGFSLTPFMTPTAHAQYYGSSYSGYYYPGYYYGCLRGCGTVYKAGTITGLTFDAINQGLYLHEYNKAQEAQIQQYQYQTEQLKLSNPQLQQDYQNIQRVAPFFDDTPPSKESKKPSPEVSPLNTKSVEIHP
jgi:hypothetical protein